MRLVFANRQAALRPWVSTYLSNWRVDSGVGPAVIRNGSALAPGQAALPMPGSRTGHMPPTRLVSLGPQTRLKCPTGTYSQNGLRSPAHRPSRGRATGVCKEAPSALILLLPEAQGGLFLVFLPVDLSPGRPCHRAKRGCSKARPEQWGARPTDRRVSGLIPVVLVTGTFLGCRLDRWLRVGAVQEAAINVSPRLCPPLPLALSAMGSRPRKE